MIIGRIFAAGLVWTFVLLLLLLLLLLLIVVDFLFNFPVTGLPLRGFRSVRKPLQNWHIIADYSVLNEEPLNIDNDINFDWFRF